MTIKEQFEQTMLSGGSIQSFVNENRELTVYYSTPAGENEEGKQMLYLMTDNAGAVYLPVFTEQKECEDFFIRIGRRNFVGLQNSLKNLLDTLDTNEMLEELGVLIDQEVPIPMKVRVK